MTNTNHPRPRGFPLSDVPPGLSDRILARISLIEVRRARIRLALFSVSALAALSGIIPASSYLVDAADRSGFLQYVSLLKSDGDVLLAHWKAFAMTLTETIPSTGAILLLSLVLIFLWSLPRVFSAAVTAFPSRRFA